MNTVARPRDVLDFWFAAGWDKWFSRDAEFDMAVRRQFEATYAAALAGRLDDWMETPEGALALVIVLDQFARNLFRDDARAWAGDAKALAFAQQAIARRFDLETPETVRNWFYLPFMHAEDIEVQRTGLDYFEHRLNDAETLRYAQLHADIIERFGRFPHRNEVLGRETTPEEQAFLDGGGFAG